jgi:hypothetical protein
MGASACEVSSDAVSFPCPPRRDPTRNKEACFVSGRDISASFSGVDSLRWDVARMFRRCVFDGWYEKVNSSPARHVCQYRPQMPQAVEFLLFSLSKPWSPTLGEYIGIPDMLSLLCLPKLSRCKFANDNITIIFDRIPELMYSRLSLAYPWCLSIVREEPGT